MIQPNAVQEKKWSEEFAPIYFEKMIELKSKTNLNELSMGMSNDYVEAAKCSSTYVRVGSKIFGARS